MVGNVVLIVLICNFFAWTLMAVVGWWNRRKPGGYYFVAQMGIGSIIVLSVIIEISASTLVVMERAAAFQLGMAPAVFVAWFLFVVGYLGYDATISKKLAALTLGTVVIVPLALTYLSGVYIGETTIETYGAYQFVRALPDELGTIVLLVSSAIVPLGVLLIIRSAVFRDDLYADQATVLVLAIFVPWGSGVLEFFGIMPNALPVGASLGVVSTGLYLYLFWRDDVFRISPATRRIGIQRAFEELDVGVIVVDDGKIVLENDTARTILDQTAANGHLRGLAIDDVLESFCEQTVAELPVTHERDGRVYELTASTIGATGYTVLIHDVTTRRERQRLERQNERLDRFASVLTHDLRNPLNVAMGHLEIARETGEDTSLEAVARAHSRLETIIDDMLTMARADTIVEETEPVLIHQLIKQTWETTTTASGTLQIDIPRNVQLGCNPDLVQHVFENLFRNAVEHNDSSVTVTVGYQEDASGTVILYVEDDGDGIPPDDRDRIFEQGYSTSKTGTGLGLSIVAELIESHGWSIAVTHGHHGGARFEITIESAQLSETQHETALDHYSEQSPVSISDE